MNSVFYLLCIISYVIYSIYKYIVCVYLCICSIYSICVFCVHASSLSRVGKCVYRYTLCESSNSVRVRIHTQSYIACVHVYSVMCMCTYTQRESAHACVHAFVSVCARTIYNII